VSNTGGEKPAGPTAPAYDDDFFNALSSDPKKHGHTSDPRKCRAAQSLVDQNLYQFVKWVNAELKTDTTIAHNDRMAMKGFFIFIRRSLHIAVCGQTWHGIRGILDSLVELTADDPAGRDDLAARLATPEMKAHLTANLGLEKGDVEEITPEQISAAFAKLFSSASASKIMKEFREQVTFIRDNLATLGFP
jgi:hypothetical protein